ncbi:hypothetical protein [Arcticibacter pallidicorallinus]|nr:hypothetical protein [Arcticibacter pallidicorallinus]
MDQSSSTARASCMAEGKVVPGQPLLSPGGLQASRYSREICRWCC